MAEKAALVTGATAGFGEAIARAFLDAGWRVIGTGRRLQRLEKLRAELGKDFLPLAFDVRDRSAVEKALATIPEYFLPIEALVNNAGLALGLERAHEADMADWETMVDTNVKGLLYMTHALAPGMVERGRGHVVNIGSIAADNPYPGGNVYGATKAFVWQFSRNLRSDLLGTGVRVTDIAPGLAETEFSLVRFKGDETRARAPYRDLESLSGDDVARAVLWVVTQPAHVNVNRIELAPTAQAWGAMATHRKKSKEP
ncbi:MAG TPA: SDR family oxidoreductase [Gammaproteobacteria bacterium]|nr:SDR family oxidoreductase [Gammaproteobacteria bacterium]